MRKDLNNTTVESNKQDNTLHNLDNVFIKDIASIRLSNALTCINIFTLQDLIICIKDRGINYIRCKKNVGKKSIDEILKILKRFGISTTDFTICKNIKTTIKESCNDKDTIQIPILPLTLLKLSPKTQYHLHKLRIYSTRELYEYFLVYQISQFGTDAISSEIKEIVNLLNSKDRWLELLQSHSVNTVFNPPLCEVNIKSNQLFPNFDIETVKIAYNKIQQLYISLASDCSVRTQRILLDTIPLFESIIFYYDYYKTIKNCGKETLHEIFSIRERLTAEINKINSLPQEELQSYWCLWEIGYQCVNDKETNFIKSFYAEHNRLPMFYILASYLHKSTNRFEKIYRTMYGILCEPNDLRTIAKQHNITHQRTHQIITTQKIKQKQIGQISFWGYYNLDNINFISRKTKLYKDVKRTEKLNKLSFIAFGYLCNLITPFKEISIGDNHYFVAKRLIDVYDFKGAIRDLEAILSQKLTQNIEIPIASIVDRHRKNEAQIYSEDIEDILCQIISDNFNLKINKHRKIKISKNYIDIATELYDIIKKSRKPMNINDIFIRFKEKYPNHNYNNSEKLRTHLVKDNRICTIGKTSRYALVEWNIYTGTIRDLIYDTLSKIKKPLTAKELLPYISKIHKTTARNIRSSVVSEKKGRFITFEKGYIGISSKKYPRKYIIATNNK